jgi:hypothetical protein
VVRAVKDPLSLFCSYAREDESHRHLMRQHLTPMQHEGLIEPWDDLEILPGTEWDAAIAAQLETVSLVVLLISPAFVASKYCWGPEMHIALERHVAGLARVVPVIVRPVDWTGAPFAKLQVVPRNARPVTLWKSRDSAWLDVAQGIRRTATDLTAKLATQPPKRHAAIVRARPAPTEPPSRSEAAGEASRTIYDAGTKHEIRGRIVRAEGDPPSGDAAVDATYDALGAFYNFFWEVHARNSIDDAGCPLTATVHYGVSYDNVFWNGESLVVGDGSGLLVGLTAVDIVAKELTYGIIAHENGMQYYGQTGALVQSISTVFGILVKQRLLGHTAEQADWLFGDRIWGPEWGGGALANLAAPGTAYDHPSLGKDPQPRHVNDYVETSEDSGGVHTNAGIPNHAFYLAAIRLGGLAWERAGRIWYEAQRGGRLPRDAQFDQFARVTRDVSVELYGEASDERAAIQAAWEAVGV